MKDWCDAYRTLGEIRKEAGVFSDLVYDAQQYCETQAIKSYRVTDAANLYRTLKDVQE